MCILSRRAQLIFARKWLLNRSTWRDLRRWLRRRSTPRRRHKTESIPNILSPRLASNRHHHLVLPLPVHHCIFCSLLRAAILVVPCHNHGQFATVKDFPAGASGRQTVSSFQFMLGELEVELDHVRNVSSKSLANITNSGHLQFLIGTPVFRPLFACCALRLLLY